jgi:hypothetical protein
VSLTFPSTGTIVHAIECVVHESYGKSLTSPYDPFDIAAFRVDIDAPAALTRSQLTATDGRVEVAGFPEREAGVLVTHEAPMKRLDDLILLHKVDTLSGHSGAPAFDRGRAGSAAVIGLHVGNFNSNPYSSLGQWNVALLIRPQLQDFIEARIAAWSKRAII